MKLRFRSLALTSALLGLAGPPAAQAAGAPQVVMSGLNNPYGLAFGPDGSLYVADAGTGGNGPTFVNGNNQTVGFGDTGDVTRLLNGVQTPVITGLPSVALANGSDATGITGLAFSGGSLFGLFGLGGVEANRNALVAALPGGNAGDLGQLTGLTPGSSTITPLSDLVPYETANYAANNPDGSTPEANPYGLAALAGGGFAVTDGGGNVVLKVASGGGAPTLLSTLPAATNPLFGTLGGPTYQSVPTGIAQGPGGTLYVGAFGGFPFPVGGSKVFSLSPSAGPATLFASGLTSITGVTIAPDGSLYVLDATTGTYIGPPTPGQIFQINRTTGAATLVTTLAAGPTYTGLVAGPDNALYISSQGVGPATGQVLRVNLAVPEPSPFALLALGLLPAGLLAARRRRA